MTSISSLSFSKPLLETLAVLSLSPPPPTSSNLRQFGDNYSLLEEMWLAVSAASWVGKIAVKNPRRFPFFLFPLGHRIVRVTLESKQQCCCSPIPFYYINFLPKSDLPRWRLTVLTILFPFFFLSRNHIHTHRITKCSLLFCKDSCISFHEWLWVYVCVCVPSWYQVKDCCTCVQRGSRWSDPVTLMAAV